MRSFFALDLDKKSKENIRLWRDVQLKDVGKAVHKNNFHITLVFLGNISEQQNTSIIKLASSINCKRFTLKLNKTGHWKKPGILWLAPIVQPEQLGDLVFKLKESAHKVGLESEERAYKPHLTLARKCKYQPENNINVPEFKLEFNHFKLFESISTENGVRYQSIQSWPLGT